MGLLSHKQWVPYIAYNLIMVLYSSLKSGATQSTALWRLCLKSLVENLRVTET